jgi:hypothetical protein
VKEYQKHIENENNNDNYDSIQREPALVLQNHYDYYLHYSYN